MYIEIAKEKIKCGAPILNGEPVIIKIDKISNNDNSLFVSTSSYAKSDDLFTNKMFIYNLGNEFAFGTELSPNFLTSAKLIKQKLIETFNLNDEDINILSDNIWREELRTIRLYIPYTSVIENSNYNSLISNILNAGTPFYKGLDAYILYLEEIYPEHLALLQTDPNVLIENK